MTSFRPSAHDRALVEAQLGRAPRGRWRVAGRCHLGVPMSIETHPRLEDGSPFPTLFWLTCPVLVKRVSRLESGGWMGELSDRLARDPELRSRQSGSGNRYVSRRDELEPLPGPHAPPGGEDRVKCLHAHVAHEISDPPNPVGALGLAATGWPDCATPCFEVTS